MAHTTHHDVAYWYPTQCGFYLYSLHDANVKDIVIPGKQIYCLDWQECPSWLHSKHAGKYLQDVATICRRLRPHSETRNKLLAYNCR